MDCREHTKEKLKKKRGEREELEEGSKNQRGMFLQERRKHKAKQWAKEERKTKELKALQKQKEEELKRERHHCKKVEGEELGKRPRYTTSAQKGEEEQQEKQEKAGPCPLLWVGGKARCDLLTTDLKTPKHQNRKSFLINNWVGERETDSRGKPDPLTSTYLLFAAQEAPKSQGLQEWQKAKPKKPKQKVPDILRVQFWMDRYQNYKEKKDKKREKKAEEQYARWTAYKASQTSLVSQQNSSYTEGFSANRHSILKY